MSAIIVILSGVFGLLIGSFLNVVIYRVPRKLSLVHPGSACPGCGHEIRAIDNIPVLSWLILRGRCRDCGMRISARYPLVELATGIAFVAVAFAFMPTESAFVAGLLVLVAFLVLAAVSIALALIDLDTHKLPNVIVLPALVAIAVLLGVAAILLQDAPAFGRAAIGAAALFLFYLMLAFVSRGGMGMGDVKLAAVLGLATAWVGWPALVVGAFAAFVFGGIFGVALLLLRRAGRRSSIPFGPWMIVGAWTGIFFGDAIWRAYSASAGLG